MSTTSSEPLVSIKLSEIKRLLDALATARDDNPRNRLLWVQWAGIYQRLCKQAGVLAGQPRNAGPYPDPAKAGV